MTVTISTPNSNTSNVVELIYGDDYYNADGRAISFSFTGFPSIVGGTAAIKVDKISEVLTFSCTVVDADTVRWEISSTEIATIGVGYWQYDLQATLSNSHVVTIVKNGTLLIEADIR